MKDSDLIRRSDVYKEVQITLMKDVAKFLIGWLDDIPAVDAVEVRHAEWKVVEDKNYLGGWKTVCSACKSAYSNKAYHEVKEFCFCPHCGARMDGRREEKHNAAD